MMFLIIYLHLGGRIIDLKELHLIGNVEHGIIWAFRSITFLGVSTYAFISGYFSIKLNVRKIFKMECMATFYGGMILLGIIIWDKPLNQNAIGLLFPASSGYLWYYSSYIQLMFLSPLINFSISNLSKDSLKGSIVGLVGIVYIGRFFSFSESCNLLTLLVGYIIGQYLRKYPVPILEQKPLLFLVTLQSTNVMIFFSLGTIGYGRILYLLEGNNNPITMLSAISLFYIFMNIKRECKFLLILSATAPYMLAASVLHEGIMVSGVIDIKSFRIPYYMSIPMSACVLYSCSAIEWLRRKIFSRIEDVFYSRLVSLILMHKR